ncbi:U3 small nucleolar RNA-associated protein [Microthyrium microscopicum]|uniref:U3 small nucleolar RNA-associated protein n=1 Tax=Microthyrium microscopicum TaxID=703497 RepID=A0A6A6U3N4_9PEZI|nr:U3 small nucleolar RNA-associated protein [Microthyrium microscopicum]
MAHQIQIKTTYDPAKVIQPIFTRGNVAITSDGRLLASCVEEDVLITDLKTGEELASIEGDGEIVTSLAITPSGSHIILCSRSLSMRIYSLKTPQQDDNSLEAELVRSIKPHDTPVVSSTVDRSGTLLATGGADGVVKVWDIKRGFITHTFHGHSGLISSLCFFEVDVSAVADDVKKSKKRKKSGEINVEDITNADKTGWRLASGGDDGKVRIWNLHKKTAAAVLESHVSVVRAIDFSVEENALLTASRDKTVMVWDCKTWKNRMTAPVLEGVEAAGFLAKGSIVYTGGETGRLRLWEIDTRREITQDQAAKSEMEGIQDAIYLSEPEILVTVLADQTLVLQKTDGLRNLTRGTKIPQLPISRRICGTHDQVVDLAYVARDKSLLAVATNSDDVRIVSVRDKSSDTDAGYFGSEVGILKGHEDLIISMDVDWSGHWLATGAKDNTARIWRLDPETNTFECYGVLTGHAESVGAVTLPHKAPAEDTPAYQNPLEHPPAFLITGAQDKTIKRWEIPKPSSAKDGKLPKPRALYTRKAHDKDINALATHPSSNLFASASQDRLVKIWAVEDGSTIGVLRGHRRGVWTLAFSPAGTQLSIAGAPATSSSRGYLLTGSGDKTVRIWSLTDYTCLLTLEGHTNSVLKVLWLPAPSTRLPHDKRGPLVASAAADTLVKIWDANSGECATTLDNHSDRVWALAAPDASTLVSGAADGVLTFWADTTTSTAASARERQAQAVEADQTLSNLIHDSSFREAIVLALQLDQPARLLSLFKRVSENAEDPTSFTGSLAVDAALGSLADAQLYRLLLRCRDWNANARSAIVAQRVIRAVVESVGLERLASLKAGRTEKGASWVEVLKGLRVYGERHYGRICDLWDESFMVEFTLREMDGLLALDDEVMVDA